MTCTPLQLVNVTTVDAFMAAVGRSLDLLKIDAEGKDRDVLQGGARQLQTAASAFSFECAPCALKLAELARFEEWGFSCYSLTRAGEACNTYTDSLYL